MTCLSKPVGKVKELTVGETSAISQVK